MEVTMELCWCDVDRKVEGRTGKSAPVPVCPSQISHVLTWDRVHASSVSEGEDYPELYKKIQSVPRSKHIPS